MKVAYFTDTFLPQVNGIATALANQAEELGAKGHQVMIFTPKLDGIKREKFKAENVQVVHLPTVPTPFYPEFKLGIFGLPKVLRYLIKFKPDIIHLHTPLTVGLDAVMAARFLKKPLIGTVHFYFAESFYLGWLKYQLAVNLVDKAVDRYLNFMFSQCDLLLVPSKILLKQLQEKSFKKPASYLPNGVTLKQHHLLSAIKKNSLKKKYSLQEKVVLHFGRLSPEKNVNLLIKAFHLLTKNHQNISLLVIGDGPAKKNLMKLVKKLDIEDQVVFTGFIEHQKLISSGFLSAGDIFATASPMENNPMVVLEAMALGLPIVGVRQAGLIELVSSNGYLAKPGDVKELASCVEKILFNKELANVMSTESLRIIKQYSIESVADQLIALYKSSLKTVGS